MIPKTYITISKNINISRKTTHYCANIGLFLFIIIRESIISFANEFIFFAIPIYLLNRFSNYLGLSCSNPEVLSYRSQCKSPKYLPV